MTRAPAHLRLMDPADDDRPDLSAVPVHLPDDGRLAHPATCEERASEQSTHQGCENSIVGFVCDLLRAPAEAVGTLARGAQEAALLTLQGARDARPGLRRPTLVLPESASPVWFTACDALGVVAVTVPIDSAGRVGLGGLAAAITEETVLVVASAPSFTHGVVDPIAWIAAACAATGTPLHVDATAGGWAIAYRRLAEPDGERRQPMPTWDFDVPGVTSLTLDVGPDRGVGSDLSVIVHRSTGTRQPLHLARLARRGPQLWPTPWRAPSGLVDDVAETLREIGHEGCSALAHAALGATADLAALLDELPGVAVAAPAEATHLTLRATSGLDPFLLADCWLRRGWASTPVTLVTGETVLRIAVTAAMGEHVAQCAADLTAALEECRGHGGTELDPRLARYLGHLRDDVVDDRAAHLLIDAAAVLDEHDDGSPSRTSQRSTYQLLQAASPRVRRGLLAAHHDRRSTPTRRTTVE
ncbi:aminotransferase class V-fold PLP-dependent enzyme [Nocardioides sp. R-C-SC26]|uniref:aminotransferase class V-fold PLP-dependent enzyme n=1 Tax=Nocardioides sp. R-C-SC26 TaxID=2870414 RepID=UPI001E5892C2|nr:aminotransferase class V-fold PLP-dependent enzyme [Nocardioides sp. R-C-SC26]